MLKKETIINLGEIIVVGALTTIGLHYADTLSGKIATEIGFGLISGIIGTGSGLIKDKLQFSRKGLLNHDIQQALKRAYVNALKRLNAEYLDIYKNEPLQENQKESIKAINSLFKSLIEHASNNFTPTIRKALNEREIKEFILNDSDRGTILFWSRIENSKLLETYNNHFVDFLKDNLLTQIQLCFAEELKTNNKENNKAWRAYLMLILTEMNKGSFGRDEIILRNIQSLCEEVKNYKNDRIKNRILDSALEETIKDLKISLDASYKKILESINRVGELTMQLHSKVDELNKKDLYAKSHDRISLNISHLNQDQAIDINSLVFPKIRVNTILSTNFLSDTSIYDFITLVGFNRKRSFNILGYDEMDASNLSLHLNNFEISFNKLTYGDHPIRRWIYINIPLEDFSSFFEKHNIVNLSNIGLIINLEKITNQNLVLLNNFLKTIDTINSYSFTIIVLVPVRIASYLLIIRELIPKEIEAYVYITNDYFVDISISHGFLLVEKDIPFYNIACLIYKEISKELLDLVTIEKIKSLLERLNFPTNLSNINNQDGFSPNAYIKEFELIICSNPSKCNLWEQLFSELLRICSEVRPDIFKSIIFLSASSKSEFIRFNTLQFLLTLKQPSLIDYWICGTRCDDVNLRNIGKYISHPFTILMTPILRYYKKHNKDNILDNKILGLLKVTLDGQLNEDFVIVEDVIINKTNDFTKYFIEKNIKYILKLSESGVDVFNNHDSFLKPGYFDLSIIYRIILATEMSSNKLKKVLRNFPELITY